MSVEIKGVKRLRYALRKFEPDLAKELQSQMASFLKPVVKKARGYIDPTPPLSGMAKGYTPFKYDAKLMHGGIGYKTTPTKPNRKGFSYAASIRNKTATGAIYETAGRKNPNGQRWVGRQDLSNKKVSHSINPFAGRQFINALGRLKGSKAKFIGRYMFRAWEEDQGKATQGVIKALQGAAVKFRQRKAVNG